MKNIFLCLVFSLSLLFLNFRTCFGKSTDNVAYSNFRNRFIELYTRLQVLQVQYVNITNDIAEYKKIYDSITVSDIIVKTNKIQLCKNAQKLVVKSRKLSAYEKKMMKTMKALDSNKLELIFSKYFKEESFDKIKSEFKEEYDDIVSQHIALLENKNIRRLEAASKAEKIIANADNEIRKKKAELTSDLRKVEVSIRNMTPGALGYEKSWKTVKSIAAKYDINISWNDCYRLVDTLKNRIDSIETAAAYDKKSQIHEINRELAAEDNDELSEETFERNKLACLSKYGDKIGNQFISSLEQNARMIASEINASLLAKAQVDKLLAFWSDLPEETIESMNEKILEDAVNVVLGENFYNDAKQRKAQLKIQLERAENTEKDHEHLEKLRNLDIESYNLSLEERRHKMHLEEVQLDLEQKRVNLEQKSQKFSEIWHLQ